MSFDTEKFIAGLHGYLERELAPLVKKVQELEKSIERIQTRGIDYRGIFREGEKYAKGDVCTHAGSMWIATRENTERPPGNGWVLCVKSGERP